MGQRNCIFACEITLWARRCRQCEVTSWPMPPELQSLFAVCFDNFEWRCEPPLERGSRGINAIDLDESHKLPSSEVLMLLINPVPRGGSWVVSLVMSLRAFGHASGSLQGHDPIPSEVCVGGIKRVVTSVA